MKRLRRLGRLDVFTDVYDRGGGVFDRRIRLR